MMQGNENAKKGANAGAGVPPLLGEIATILLVFLGALSLLSLLLAPERLNAQGFLNIVALAAFPLAYGVWREKKWAFYASVTLLEALIIVYPLFIAFSPYFGLEYRWISALGVIIVGLTVPTLLIANERYARFWAGTSLQAVIKRLPMFNALFVIFGISLLIRAVLPYDTVFKDSVRFASDDAVFHMRLVENALFGNHFPFRPFFDAYTYFPHGQAIHFAPLFELPIVFATWILSLGVPTKALMEAVGAYYPPILGSLVVFPVYIIGREIYNKYAGLLAAVLVATLPGQFLSRSILGFTDHHVAEVLFSTVAVMFLILALKSAKEELSDEQIRDWLTVSPKDWIRSKNVPILCYVGAILLLFQVVPWGWWVFLSFVLFLLAPIIFRFWKKPDSYVFYTMLAGMALGFYLLVWVGALIFVFIFFLYGIVQYIINGLRNEPSGYIYVVLSAVFFIPLLMMLPFYPYPFVFCDIRHIGSLGVGFAVFACPLLYRQLRTRVSKAEPDKDATMKPQSSGKGEYICPICGKKSRAAGILEHIKSKHHGETEDKSTRIKMKRFFDENPELNTEKRLGIESLRGTSATEKIARYNLLFFGVIVFLLFVLALAFIPPIKSSFVGFFSQSGAGLTVAENHPMDSGTAWVWFGTPFFISLFAMILLAGDIVKKTKPEKVLLLVWSILMFIAVGGLGIFGVENLGQNRFAYYYAINAALLTGFFATFALESLIGIGENREKEERAPSARSGKKGGKAKSSKAGLDLRLITFAFAIMIIAIIGLLQVGIWSLIPLAVIVAIFFLWMHAASRKRTTTESTLTKTLAVLLIMVIVFYPFPLNAVSSPFPSTSNLPLTAVNAINTAERGIGADETWYEALRWMRNNTPEPGVDYYGLYEVPPLNETTGQREDYAYPPSAYGVMSWWDYGHMITWVAHRIPNANPFQSGIGGPGQGDTPGASVFFLADTEEEANEMADALGVRYVVSDFMMADIWNAYYNKYGAMTTWAGDSQRYNTLAYYYTTIEARLHMFDGATANVDGTIIPPLNHYRLVHESPAFVLPLIIMDESKGYMYWRSYSGDYGATNAQAQILHGHLFSINAVSWIEDDLNNKTLPELLESALNSSGIPFSGQSTVTKLSEGRWSIRDEQNDNVFIIKKQNGMLEAYLYGIPTGQPNIKAWTPEYLQPVSFVKIFEYVPGAHVTGTAPNGSIVEISTEVTTNQGRAFNYTVETTSNGSYEFIVPYSTEGPIEGGTQFDTTVSPYTIRTGHYEDETKVWDVEQEVRITEGDVMDGGTITVDLM